MVASTAPFNDRRLGPTRRVVGPCPRRDCDTSLISDVINRATVRNSAAPHAIQSVPIVRRKPRPLKLCKHTLDNESTGESARNWNHDESGPGNHGVYISYFEEVPSKLISPFFSNSHTSARKVKCLSFSTTTNLQNEISSLSSCPAFSLGLRPNQLHKWHR